jgi:hypothetical protein
MFTTIWQTWQRKNTQTKQFIAAEGRRKALSNIQSANLTEMHTAADPTQAAPNNNARIPPHNGQASSKPNPPPHDPAPRALSLRENILFLVGGALFVIVAEGLLLFFLGPAGGQ